jgi:predicted amidohydrolase
MQDLKVTLVQANQIWEDKSANFSNYLRLLESINEPVDLVIFPEMFDTGFSMNVELAEDWNSNASVKFLVDLAVEKQFAIYTSLMVKDNNQFCNRGVFVYPSGAIKYYDKRKSFGLGGEDKFYTAGNTETIVKYKNWKINLQICYDLRFPEIARNHEVDGKTKYDLLLYVANWPSKRSEHWKTLLKARAIENQSYVIGVNRFGEDTNGLSYSGDSSCFDPLGNIYCHLENESIFTTTLSELTLTSTRTSLPFLKDY